MNSASLASYDDESSYDFESDTSSPWVFSPTDSTATGSTASLDEEDEEDEDEDESSEEDSGFATSPMATLSPTSPDFHPTGFNGPTAPPAFGFPPHVSPECPAAANSSYPMSYSSFSNYPATAPRLQVPQPPKLKKPPPPPVVRPKPSTLASERHSEPVPRPKPKPSSHRPPAPPPTAASTPPPPPMARSKSSTISHLRDAISSLEAQMAQLLAQKRELQTRLDQEVRVQSPVNRLPSELLSSIFVIGVLGPREEEDDPVMLGTVVLVCRQWNEVALNTPKLWSKINVNAHDSLSKAKRRLDRSKSSPLDIAIDFGPRVEYTTTTTTYTSSASTSLTSQSNSASQSVGVSSASGSTSSSYIPTNPLVLNSNGNATTTHNANASTKTTTTTVNVIDAIIRSMELFKLVLWRTRSFTLRVPNRHQAHAALMRCREYPAPLLEHLTIHIYHSMLDGPSYISASGAITTASTGSSEAYSYGAAGKLTPLPLFDGQTPLLKTCSFTSFNFGWDVTMVKRLKVLKLGGYFNGYAPSLGALVAILRECPELEELSLRNLSEGEGDVHGAGLSGHGLSSASCYPDRCTGCAPLGAGATETSTASSSASAAATMMGNGTSKIIVLPKLHSLTLYYASPAHSLLPFLSLPALTNLTIAFLQNISSILQCLYTQALTRLPLKTMRIESCVFNELTFINLMKKLNGLVKLELVDVEDLSGGALRSLTSLSPHTPSPLPRVTHLTLDGCTSLDFDSLRIFVEARLPPNPATFKRIITNPKEIVSSASEAARLAEAAKLTRARHTSASASAAAGGHNAGSNVNGGELTMWQPARLVSVDVTRCTQISKEMVQWLRMYVAEVKCESAKGVWGDV
ncbi:hypothetical protein EST38_g1435 [Candolleomyces aberdarensis]|uniref:F-box domain-containing protein n=1 Tax=Candolleomyces aberdarensis TaxID=2316362 RepID=A0A4Q2DY27_9AGAR|nr:hypothetical protein EST38_g1435 [Candolleomyces aberdarensis]